MKSEAPSHPLKLPWRFPCSSSSGWAGKEASIPALALGGANGVPKVRNVELLGHKGKLKWTQDAAALKVEMPEAKPSGYAVTFKIALA